MFYPHSYQYTTPLLNSWQQFSLSEICNHICNSRSRHSTQAKAKVVPHFCCQLPSTPGHSAPAPHGPWQRGNTYHTIQTRTSTSNGRRNTRTNQENPNKRTRSNKTIGEKRRTIMGRKWNCLHRWQDLCSKKQTTSRWNTQWQPQLTRCQTPRTTQNNRINQEKLFIRLANSKAGIKPTAPLSAFDKENSIEFPLDFSTLLIQLLHGLCAIFPCLSCDLSCDIMWCDAVTSRHVTMTMWHFPTLPSV